MVNIQKAAVIGCGFVGSTIAYTLMQKGLFSEMVLLDANGPKAEGEAMEICIRDRLSGHAYLYKWRSERLLAGRGLPAERRMG